MLVYRLENVRGRGPWSVQNTPHYLISNIDTYYSDDSIYQYGRSQDLNPMKLWQNFGLRNRFGMDSVNGLIEYFGSSFAKLLDDGFVIAVYKVRKNYVMFGEFEVVFDINKAEKVN